MKIFTTKSALLLSGAAMALALPTLASAQSAPTVKFGGFIKAVGSFSQYSAGEPTSATIRDFYAGQTIPTGAANDYTAFSSNAKQSRLFATITSDVAGHTVKGYIEGDFQAGIAAGSQTATNAYNPALRRAFMTVDKLTIGQDWSTFQNPAVLPESTDYAGTLDGTVFVRQPLVRYTTALSPMATLMVSAENAETVTVGTIAATSDDDKMPDFAARLALKTAIGDFSVAGLVRQLTVVSGAYDQSETGAGVSASGVIPFGAKKQNKVTFMATYGEGIGRYMAAAATPDAVTTATGIDTIATTNLLASVKFAVSDTSRINLMAGYHDAELPSGYTNTALTKSLQSVAVNYFITPVKGVDFGVEYRHATHEKFGGAEGDLDRVEFSARYAF